MQINKKSILEDFYGPRVFFVEHIELDLNVQFSNLSDLWCGGMAFLKLNFLGLNYRATIWLIIELLE